MLLALQKLPGGSPLQRESIGPRVGPQSLLGRLLRPGRQGYSPHPVDVLGGRSSGKRGHGKTIRYSQNCITTIIGTNSNSTDYSNASNYCLVPISDSTIGFFINRNQTYLFPQRRYDLK